MVTETSDGILMKQVLTNRPGVQLVLTVMLALAPQQSPACPPNRPTGHMVARGQAKTLTVTMPTPNQMQVRQSENLNY